MIFRSISVLCIALLLAAHARAEASTGLQPAIRALGTTLRILQVTAHPGDEDGALLLYQVRAQGAQVTLLTLTRGERGDNPHGILEPTEQGLLRTMEQLASDAQYGVDQRFTRMVDFGFARTADEVFDRWGGHDTALGDIVRVIRETRPEIIITPFDVTSPDGDGQHQATAILVREAFHAAADAKKFPEQLSSGLEPWQTMRLFTLTHSGGYSVAFNAGALGLGERESWQQQALRALAEQRSQQGAWHAPQETVRHYRLIDFAPGFSMSDGAADFADGLDSALIALTSDAEFGKPGLAKEDLLRLQSRVQAMSNAVLIAQQKAPQEKSAQQGSIQDDGTVRAECIVHIAEYLRNLGGVEDRMLVTHALAPLRAELAEKRKQAERALLIAAGVRVQARLVDSNQGSQHDGQDSHTFVLIPGANYAVDVQVEARAGVSVRVAEMALKPEGGRWTPKREWTPGDTHAVFRGRVPGDAPFTRPQFLLEDEEGASYRILDERNATRALPPPSLQAVVELEIAGEVVQATTAVEARDGNADPASPQASEMHPVVVAPAISVIVEPRIHWNRRSNTSYGEIEVRVRSNLPKLQNAMLSVHPPLGWRAEPDHEVLLIENPGEEHSYRFFLIQETGGAGAVPVRAVVRWGSAVFDQGYTIVRASAADQVAFDYRSSNGELVSADVDVPENLSIGYVGVAGDPIPGTLRDINVKVADLDREALMHERLGKYWAIVLGPHAVDTRDDLAEARTQLLRYAEDGGALLILAQSDPARFSLNAPVPYPLELGTARVTNEASAVAMTDDSDELFHDPNDIADTDFRGWIEERGRYFAQRWDGHFQPLLRMGDPGQPAQEGALLEARYGRGSVVYTGLSFYRQLPAGVPGAMRLLINLLSPAEELHR